MSWKRQYFYHRMQLTQEKTSINIKTRHLLRNRFDSRERTSQLTNLDHPKQTSQHFTGPIINLVRWEPNPQAPGSNKESLYVYQIYET